MNIGDHPFERISAFRKLYEKESEKAARVSSLMDECVSKGCETGSPQEC